MEKFTKNFTIEQMAGQRLMLGFEGTTLNQELKSMIREIKPGGIILFAYNIESPDQIARLCADAQSHAANCDLPPLFISIDQEGGVVARLSHPFTRFNGNPHINSRTDAENFAKIIALELSGAGINMNLAPVMDVVPKGVDSIMKERAFPGDAQIVSDLGSIVIKTMQDQKIMAVAKHFPGIGRTIKDSHFSLPVLDVDIDTLKSTDIKPFEAARDADVAGIMLSHIFYPRLDSKWQASLSPFIVQELLRGVLGYEGLVLTDDLDMKAIGHDMKTCVEQILKSGIDISLICHKGPNIGIARQEMVRLLGSDESLFDFGMDSMKRILKFKKKYLDAVSKGCLK